MLDRATQAWVKATGRRVALVEHPWLRGPIGAPDRIADAWIEQEAGRLGANIRLGGGLLGSMAELSGGTFDAADLSEPVRAFYERTSDWRVDVWSQWCPAALPFAWLIVLAFARRLEQLSMPLRPLDVSAGLESRVVRIVDNEERQLGAAWLRTLRRTGRVMYSGFYGVVTLPGNDRPSIKVSFPLPNGSVVVLLRPDCGPGGSLALTSPAGSFGEDGAYLIVAGNDDRVWARRIPVIEQFRVYTDELGVVRTDHALDLWHIPALKLHYRMDPIVAAASVSSEAEPDVR